MSRDPAALVEVSQAAEIGAAIQEALEQISNGEAVLEHSYARLGALLVRAKSGEYWREWKTRSGVPYINFDHFMVDVSTRYNKSVRQLYDYVGVAEILLPYISASNLDKIGISKAKELKRAQRQIERRVPDAAIELALRPETTTKELRTHLFATLTLEADTRPAGTYFDFGGAYLTAEEKAEFLEFVKVGMAVLKLSKAMPDWACRKELLLWAAREFVASHGPEVYGPKAEENPNMNGAPIND